MEIWVISIGSFIILLFSLMLFFDIEKNNFILLFVSIILGITFICIGIKYNYVIPFISGIFATLFSFMKIISDLVCVIDEQKNVATTTAKK